MTNPAIPRVYAADMIRNNLNTSRTDPFNLPLISKIPEDTLRLILFNLSSRDLNALKLTDTFHYFLVDRNIKEIVPNKVQLKKLNNEPITLSELKDYKKIMHCNFGDTMFSDILREITHLDLSESDPADIPSLLNFILPRCPNLAPNGVQLPQSLKGLDLSGDTAITDISSLRLSQPLRWIDLSGCTSLTGIDNLQLPPSLEWINLTGCSSLIDINNLQLPSTLESLYLSGCTGLTNINNLQLPGSLEWLDLLGCTGLARADINFLTLRHPDLRILF